MAAVTSIIGIGLSVVGQVIGFNEKKKAAKKQEQQRQEALKLEREAQEKQKRIRDLETVRKRRAASREAQIRRSNIVSAAEGANISGSSGAAGAQGAVQSQTTANLSFLDQANTLNDQASTLFGQAREVASRPVKQGQFGAALQSVGQGVFSLGQSDIFA